MIYQKYVTYFISLFISFFGYADHSIPYTLQNTILEFTSEFLNIIG
jgi:hypothetical protein